MKTSLKGASYLEIDIETEIVICHSQMYRICFSQNFIEIGKVVFTWLNHRQKNNRHKLIFITIRIFMLNNNLKIPGKSWVLKFLKSREVVVVSARGRGGEKCRTSLPSWRLHQRTDTWSPVCFSGLFRLQLFVLTPLPPTTRDALIQYIGGKE